MFKKILILCWNQRYTIPIIVISNNTFKVELGTVDVIWVDINNFRNVIDPKASHHFNNREAEII